MSKHGSVGVAQNLSQNRPAYTPGSKSYDEQLMFLGALSTLKNMNSYTRGSAMDSTMSGAAAAKLMQTYNPNVPGMNLAKLSDLVSCYIYESEQLLQHVGHYCSL